MAERANNESKAMTTPPTTALAEQLLDLLKDCHADEEAHLQLRLIRDAQATRFEALKNSHPEIYADFIKARTGPHEVLLRNRRKRVEVITGLIENPKPSPQPEPEPAKAEWRPRFKVGQRVRVKPIGAEATGAVLEVVNIDRMNVQVMDPTTESEDPRTGASKTARWFSEEELEPYTEPTPWQLPPLPAGLAYHREDWTEEMLQGGWRPLLMGEKVMPDDQCSRPQDRFGLDMWGVVGGTGTTNADKTWNINGWFLRTLRPLPTPQPAEKAQSAGTAGESLISMIERVERDHFRTVSDTGANRCALLVWNIVRQFAGLPRIWTEDLPKYDKEKNRYLMPEGSKLLTNPKVAIAFHLAQSKKRIAKRPRCGESTVHPWDSGDYCENCGWPDENKKQEVTSVPTVGVIPPTSENPQQWVSIEGYRGLARERDSLRAQLAQSWVSVADAKPTEPEFFFFDGEDCGVMMARTGDEPEHQLEARLEYHGVTHWKHFNAPLRARADGDRDERLAFEEWAKGYHSIVDGKTDLSLHAGEYYASLTQDLWKAWQAGRGAKK